MKEEHLTPETIHDHVDGLLDGAALRRADRHLQVCARCRAEREAVAEVVEALHALPSEAAVPGGVWEEVRARMGWTDEATVRVLSLGSGGGRRTGPRRVSLTWSQLAAAGLVLATVSAGTAWWATNRAGDPTSPPAVGVVETPAVRAAAAGPEVPVAAYDSAIRDLDAALAQGRAVLEPETLRVLEESLATIDAAIMEAREALARDPGSPVLARILGSHLRTKIRVLRQATSIVHARS